MDALRLAVGTLTVLPTRPPRTVDQTVGGRAMTLAPVVGGVLAGAGGLLLWLLGWGPPTKPSLVAAVLGAPYETGVPSLLAAALVLGFLALITRAMHLDGLADTADGLGSGKAPAEALEVMRRGDVGPFGVVTLVLVLMVQVFSLAALAERGLAVPGLVLATVTSRLALPLACRRSVPAARPDGLGHLVAGTVGPGRLAASALLAVTTVGLLWLIPLLATASSGGWVGVDLYVVPAAVVASAVALGAAVLLIRRAVRRLGGVTGDVLGATVEVTFTAALVVLVLAT